LACNSATGLYVVHLEAAVGVRLAVGGGVVFAGEEFNKGLPAGAKVYAEPLALVINEIEPVAQSEGVLVKFSRTRQIFHHKTYMCQPLNHVDLPFLPDAIIAKKDEASKDEFPVGISVKCLLLGDRVALAPHTHSAGKSTNIQELA